MNIGWSIRRRSGIIAAFVLVLWTSGGLDSNITDIWISKIDISRIST